MHHKDITQQPENRKSALRQLWQVLSKSSVITEYTLQNNLVPLSEIKSPIYLFDLLLHSLQKQLFVLLILMTMLSNKYLPI